MTDTRPEIKVRSDGGQVVLSMTWRQDLFTGLGDFAKLSTQEATLLASTLYSIAVGIEAVRIKEEREKAILITRIAFPETNAIIEAKPATWRDRESML